MHLPSLRLGLTAAALLSFSPFVAAQTFVVPANDGFVTDTAGILDPAEEAQIEEVLTQYRAQTSNEVAIVIIPSLDGGSIADAAVEIGRKWGIGTPENDNGILILVSYGDRTVFLATGYGLEGSVPDIVAKGIIDEDIAPQFREGNYAEGLLAGIDALKKHIGGEYTAERYAEEPGGDFSWVLFILFIVFNASASFFARTKSWWAGGIVGAVLGIVFTAIFGWWLSIPILVALGLLFDYILSKTGGGGRGGRGGMWTGGSGFRSGGGGGFGGFSGGSFGGGGASGKW